MLSLSPSYDPVNLAGPSWITPGVTCRGSMSLIMGPTGSGKSLFATQQAVDTAARRLQAGVILTKECGQHFGLRIAAAVQAAGLDDAERQNVKRSLLHHDAIASALTLDAQGADEGLQRLEAALRNLDLLVVDDIADLLAAPSVLRHLAKVVRATDAALLVVCPTGWAHAEILKPLAGITLSLIPGDSDVRVTPEKIMGAPPKSTAFRIVTARVATCTGDTVASPAIEWLRSPKTPSHRLGDTPPSRANQPATL